MLRPARCSLSAVVWVLAAAADFENRIPACFTAAVLADEAGVGAGVAEAHRVAARAVLAAGRRGAPPVQVAPADWCPQGAGPFTLEETTHYPHQECPGRGEHATWRTR